MSDRVRLESLDDVPDGRRFSPSVARNRDEIRDALRTTLPRRGVVVEVASGTGEHAIHVASCMPDLIWHPTDRDAEALASIAAWRRRAQLENLRPAQHLDVVEPWPIDYADAVVAINFFHITPWEACQAFLSGAAGILAPRGTVVIYGAFLCNDRPTAPSNLDFDARLRETDPSYGVRHLEAVEQEASRHGLELARVTSMPNNNFLLVLEPR